MLGDAPLPWAVAVLGGSIFETPLAGMALERGGHLRVGLEDDPKAKSNTDEVARARSLCAAHGRSLASSEETTSLLCLPKRPTP